MHISKMAQYIFLKKKNLDRNTIKGKKALAMIMPRNLSVNIDDKYDLEISKFFLKRRK